MFRPIDRRKRHRSGRHRQRIPRRGLPRSQLEATRRRGRLFDRARGLDWPPEWTLRARSNNTFERTWRGKEEAIDAAVSADFAAAVQAGDTEIMPVIVGEAVDLVRGVRSAKAIAHDICATAANLLAAAPRRLAYPAEQQHQ